MTPPLILAAAEATSSYLPHILLGAYMLLLIGLCVVGYRKGKATEEDYYLAGRGQGVLVTSLTIMATMFSSAALLGIPGQCIVMDWHLYPLHSTLQSVV